MTDMDNARRSDEVLWDTTSTLSRADLLNESGLQPTVGVSPVEELPPGSALLVVKRGPNTGCRFQLDRPVTSAGRHPSSDIFLDDVTVSRKHVEFRWDGDELRIVDLGSLNGTYVNREAVNSAVLVNGDEVQLGKFRLMFFSKRRNDGGTGAEAPASLGN
jgi:pSer/pThr/pTyr-binding forkhead associated (FHA) protein